MLSHISIARIIVKNPVLRNAPVFILSGRHQTSVLKKNVKLLHDQNKSLKLQPTINYRLYYDTVYPVEITYIIKYIVWFITKMCTFCVL